MSDPNLVRLPDLSKISPLHPSHDEWRIKQRSAIPTEYFMYEVGNFQAVLPEHGLGNPVHLPACVPGKPDGTGFGWRHCDFLLVLPAVHEVDNVFRSCLVDGAGEFLRDELKRLGIDEEYCLATHAVRFALPPGLTSYKSQHKLANYPYVQADAFACMPKAIITFGSDPLKSLFGKNAKLESFRGSVHEWNGMKVIPTVQPGTFYKNHGGIDVFRSELYRAVQVTMGTYKSCSGWKPGYTWCKTIEEMTTVAKEIIEGGFTQLAIDTEFGNDTSREEDGYLLSFQVSWAPGKAAFFQLRNDRGGLRWTADDRAIIDDIIRAIVKRPGVRLFGQHLRTDVEIPKREGLNWEELLETGFDTMLANHLLRGGDGDEGQGLDQLTRRYCPEMGAYWKPVEDWLDANGRSENLRFGYRNIPMEILALYGCQDVDVTIVAGLELVKELEAQPVQKVLFENIVMPCSAAIMDIQSHGILLDTPRIKELHDIYLPEVESLLTELRDEIEWPDFNPNSNAQKAALLFSGTEYRDKKIDPATGRVKGVPESARVLDLEPLYNTDKFPREWSVIEMAGESKYHSPSCKAATIDLLYQRHKDKPGYEEPARILKKLKQLSVLSKFLTTYLSEAEVNEFGVREGGKNIGNNIGRDGRVRGRIHQTSSTGRWRMSAANLQTNPKKQELAAFEVFVDRRLGLTIEQYRNFCKDECRDKHPELWIAHEDRIENKIPTFKSCYISPKGSSIIEVDFKTAEVCVLAFASGDKLLTRIIEQDRDLHSETAVKAFKLPLLGMLNEALAALDLGDKTLYEAFKKAVKKDYEGLRTAAKTVVFGLMYGRGAPALAREICKTGAMVTTEDCQQIINGFATSYPDGWKWIQDNMDSAINNEYVQTPFGRRRYFAGVSNMGNSEKAAARREAANSPIQGCVADLLAQAAINFHRYLRGEEGRSIGYKMLLPIHDAFWIEVKNEHVDRMKEIIKACMSTWNKIPGTEKSLGVDIEVFPFRVGDKKGEKDDRPDFADPEWDPEYKLELDKAEAALRN